MGSDEAFGIFDIQFDLPGIRVLPDTAGEVIVEISFIISVLVFGRNEFSRSVELGHSLPKC